MNVDIVEWHEIKLPPARQRTESAETHIKDLAASIQENGLLHAPVVGPDLTLIAGFCRYQAVRLLMDAGVHLHYNGERIPLGYLPVVQVETTDEAGVFRIELEENVRRKNLSPVEQASAVAKLHELLSAQNPLQTNKDTAEELLSLRGGSGSLNYTQQEVADSIILSQFADDPDVQAARTRKSAVLLAKRKMEREFRDLIGASEISTSARAEQTLRHGDSFQLIKDLAAETFDGIITDPPYGIDADTFGSAGFLSGEHSYSDSSEYAFACYELLATEGFRVARPEAFLLSFLDIRHFPKVSSILEAGGWRVWPTPLIWYKGTTAHAPRPQHGPKRTYEALVFASKGDRTVISCGTDVISVPAVGRTEKLHSAEKPKELFLELYKHLFSPGNSILDPFAGSGASILAAKEFGLPALGLEAERETYNIALSRLSEDI